MAKSKVYFTNFRTTLQENQLQKLARLVKTAGMLENIQFKDRYTAIKIHFGEPGNLAFLRAGGFSSPTATRSTWAGARTPWIT